MTYCVAAIVSAGIVFASDSRTNAGVDQISTYSKMNLFETLGERLIALLTAGNLATTPLRRRFADRDPAFTQLSSYWSASLRRVFVEAPDVSWS